MTTQSAKTRIICAPEPPPQTAVNGPNAAPLPALPSATYEAPTAAPSRSVTLPEATTRTSEKYSTQALEKSTAINPPFGKPGRWVLGEGSLNARFADLEDAGNLRQRMPIGAEFLGGLAALRGHHSQAAADAALGLCVFQDPHGVFAACLLRESSMLLRLQRDGLRRTLMA